ncbi:MAG TPA: molybdopterin molybdenumtransferase MoeA, partial [Rhizobiales bacterium]|nr:molybdopterin molybdenumtransferase MoeA [Hyphomicrobiales bacterium]
MALLPVSKAKKQILAGVKPSKSELVHVTEAAGRVLAKDLKAKRHQPPFAASSMDGYAVRAADIASTPADLEVIGEAPAGRQFSGTVKAGQAVRIFTGAPVPRGADTVIMQENTSRSKNTVTIEKSEEKGHFIRPAGLDFKKGDPVLATDTLLNARNTGLCAAMNYGKVPVRKRPTVAILATGDELVRPGEKLRVDQIVSSNSIALAATISAFGGQPLDLGIVPDNLKKIEKAIKSAAKADILLTIGGASVGDHDLIGPAFANLGIKLDFWKIAMRPGKPLIFAKKGNQRILGLPGNPVSALVCARIYLKPLIEKMLGLTSHDDIASAKLTEPLR